MKKNCLEPHFIVIKFGIYVLAAGGPAFGYSVTSERISEIEFWEQVSLDRQGDVAPAPGEPQGIAIVGIVVGLCVPISVVLPGHGDVGLAARQELDLLELHAANDHGVIALPGAQQHIGIEHVARGLTLLGTVQVVLIGALAGYSYKGQKGKK